MKFYQKKHAKVSQFAEIRECPTTGSKSLHATVNLMPGQVISRFGAKEIRNQPSYLTVQIHRDRHIMLDPEWLQYINHSCNPNVVFNTSKQDVIAVRPLEKGEEITFFYPSTEWLMDRAFDCLCNSDNCLGTIQGAAHLPLEILTNYQLSDYIQQELDRKAK
ncbi:SET domain-containing protein-lysine N-methyltransferase [Roseofilum reptotaenium CS-1145]|uniref:SET domain-containing protein-lysine N-methyltransferase n=1 Tax=Roseofilum reptotaenium AO1-A TaxID=1925591 RepID=A0A1L9QVZ7_9CYAN|nr:SET domain-containing protein-lysine N-methyltransferase [Roseofilum reptotaenium]MDB9518120.1 SET domain-containing protein-lysine N-methyltransferase [Roseofilum reptotaenium CS-1145]OJJ26806.1 SET domain-containing protein-lysine N-methyltransferase [Roseofilum reptotaenium AO1-A]